MTTGLRPPTDRCRAPVRRPTESLSRRSDSVTPAATGSRNLDRASPSRQASDDGRSAELDGDADQRPVLRPGSVVVLDVRVPEQLLEREPRVRAALADPAIRDHLAIRGDALGLVQRPQLVGALEGAVVVGRLDPRD